MYFFFFLSPSEFFLRIYRYFYLSEGIAVVQQGEGKWAIAHFI